MMAALARVRWWSAAFLVVLWMVMWGTPSVANFLSGLAVVVLVMMVFPFPAPVSDRAVVHPHRLLAFIGFFALRLVQANITMARTVLSPRPRLHPAIVEVPLRCNDHMVATVVSAFVTLTPGTLTLDVREHPRSLFIHVLQYDGHESVEREVALIERMAVQAFGSRAARLCWAGSGAGTAVVNTEVQR